MAYLDLKRITKRFRGTVAVDDLSLSVEEGEMLCLLGPSGCGKTTTLRAIAGFESIDAGRIYLRGNDVTNLPPENRDIGLVFQNYALFPHLTVRQNIAFGLEMRRKPADEVNRAVLEALELVQLDGVGERYPRQLSGGQQQRVALARAIAIQPQLLLLDEPLSNLDAKLRDSMRDEIRRVQRLTSITAIFVTHDQGEALAMADRMAVMDRGRIVQVDTPLQVYARPVDPFIAGFIGKANLLPGRMVSHAGSGAALDAGGGLILPGITETALQPGEAAVAVIKSERVNLTRQQPVGAMTSVPVRVDGCTFLGATMAYNCSLGDRRLSAILAHSESTSFAVGDLVYASWLPADCLILRGAAEPVPMVA